MEEVKIKRLLQLLEDDALLSKQALADLLDEDISSVQTTIQELEAVGMIAGYKTMINWDSQERADVSAMIEVTVNLHAGVSYSEIAEMIYHYDEVESLYLTSGTYDYILITKRLPMYRVSQFVNKLGAIDEVTATATHIVMNRYKDHGTIFANRREEGGRLVVSQ